ncbi:MAG: ferrochelatase [Rhodospirillaceae bacterium]
MSRTAVVVYNLGGPDGPDAVRPFLKNLFSDPMIIRLPWPLRWLVAELISRRRAPVAREIYAKLGGRSPILPETRKQADALQAVLGEEYRVFVAMRYWHPFADRVVRDVAAWAPDRVILLPLYPQFSTTTTGSFLRVWQAAARAAGLAAPTSEICCWPEAGGFVDAVVRRVRDALAKLPDGAPCRVLFSAHGLPKKIVEAGDPYAEHVNRTASAVLARLDMPGLDHVVCFQSRVGPLEWLKPYTEAEIRRAGAGGLALVVVPVAFVSEHSETLVELDIEYAELARECGVPHYVRAPTVDADPAFVAALADLVRAARQNGIAPGGRPCGPGFADCPCRNDAGARVA